MQPAVLEVLGSSKAAPVIHFSRDISSQVHRVRRKRAGHSITPSSKAWIDEYSTLGQLVLPGSTRYIVHRWLHRDTLPHNDSKETPSSIAAQLCCTWEAYEP